jgi:hypothetical protein
MAVLVDLVRPDCTVTSHAPDLRKLSSIISRAIERIEAVLAE